MPDTLPQPQELHDLDHHDRRQEAAAMTANSTAVSGTVQRTVCSTGQETAASWRIRHVRTAPRSQAFVNGPVNVETAAATGR
jgi:hypothetical protein